MCRQESPRPGPIGTQRDSYWPDLSTAQKKWDEWSKEAGDWTSEKASLPTGHGKSLLLTLIDLLPLKQASPVSTALLKHYVERIGSPYELTEVPAEWQTWIENATKGQPGKYKDLNPYNAGIYDLRNSLGHFDVNVKANNSKTKTYEISDRYEFGFKKHDKGQTGRHGFPLGDMSETELSIARGLLPSTEYQNPGGFKEKWEIRKAGSEITLLIPQKVLEEQGKPFDVKGSFTK